MYSSLFFLLIFAMSFLQASPDDWVPILEEGRFRPIAALSSPIQLSPRHLSPLEGVPLADQLRSLPGPKLIPVKGQGGRWVSLDALGLKTANFTPFSPQTYQELQQAYWEKNLPKILSLLGEEYPQLAGTPYLRAAGKSLSYPSVWQLKAEAFYMKFPLIGLAIFLYSSGVIFLLFFPRGGRPLLTLAFLLHTFILALRCYILERPPVSNMFETVIYVPWISMGLSLLLDRKKREPQLLACGAAIAILLLVLLKITGLNEKMENVQAVLDSQFWLLIHVLMVVGSYGVFLLAGVCAHVELIRNPRNVPVSPLLPLLYMGTVLLIGGTILGGIWAAQSWGRFWDWDPKESWAFISSSLYLLLIHAYRFGKISTRGLAIGSIVGLLAISFTWYGVNYVLGTGLHSYGFGNGGEVWYYLYIGIELLFLFWVVRKNKNTLLQN